MDKMNLPRGTQRLGLLFLLGLLATPSLGHASNPVGPRADQARAVFAAGQYQQAAKAFEALYAETKEPKYRYNAGIARSRAGHKPEAIFHYSAYLALGGGQISAADTADAQQRLGEAIPGTTSVAVTVAPASALSQATIAIQTNGGPRIEAPLQAFIDQQGVQPGAYLLYLDTRPWTIEITSPGHATKSTRLTLAPGDVSRMISVSLKPDATPITVNLGPDEAVAAGATLTFSSTDGSGAEFEVPATQASVTQGLVPGKYTVKATAPGFRTVERPLIVGHAEHQVNLDLVPDPAATVAVVPQPAPLPLGPEAPAEAVPSLSETDDQNPRARRNLAIVTGVASAGLAGATIGLAIVGHQKFSSTIDRETSVETEAGIEAPIDLSIASDPAAVDQFNAVEAAYPKAELAADMNQAFRLQYAAAGTAGASFGMLVTALTAAKAKTAKAWKVELGLGSALAVGGAVWFGVHQSIFQNQLVGATPQTARYDAYRLHNNVTRQFRGSGLGAALVLGAGSSLVVGSTIGLLVDRKGSKSLRAQVIPSFGRGQAGLSLSGQF